MNSSKLEVLTYKVCHASGRVETVEPSDLHKKALQEQPHVFFNLNKHKETVFFGGKRCKLTPTLAAKKYADDLKNDFGASYVYIDYGNGSFKFEQRKNFVPFRDKDISKAKSHHKRHSLSSKMTKTDFATLKRIIS